MTGGIFDIFVEEKRELVVATSKTRKPNTFEARSTLAHRKQTEGLHTGYILTSLSRGAEAREIA